MVSKMKLLLTPWQLNNYEVVVDNHVVLEPMDIGDVDIGDPIFDIFL